ncbi:hypothetical protein [Micromonospora sp. NPDC023956]|uniref:hypothetical protein n=1 Tax=Micromonospora sp. NPDC023956 TaxID=3155722 RepID=UPI0033F19B3B
MISRLRALLGGLAERRKAAREALGGWETEQGTAELALLVAQVREEAAPEPYYLPRHDGEQTRVGRDYLLPPDYWTAERWRPLDLGKRRPSA